MLSSVQRRQLFEQALAEQTIKADVLRDWIEKIREAFDRTLFYKNFVEGGARTDLDLYITEHPEDKVRADSIRDLIEQTTTKSQEINHLLEALDQKIGQKFTPPEPGAEVPAPAPAEKPAEAPAEAPEAPAEKPKK
jgi:hypothetical protein